MKNPLRVFITDDDTFFRSAISIVINAADDMEVIGQAENGIEAIEKIQYLKPDVVLMDIQMPKMNGIECLKILKKQYPTLCILLLTTFNEEEYILEGLVNGLSGYLIKDMDYHVLIKTIRDVKNGQYILPVEVATKLAKFSLQTYQKPAKQNLPPVIEHNDLSEKEQEIALLLMQRLTTKEMASLLHLGTGTIRNYLTIIYQKIGVKNRQEAIALLQKEAK